MFGNFAAALSRFGFFFGSSSSSPVLFLFSLSAIISRVSKYAKPLRKTQLSGNWSSSQENIMSVQFSIFDFKNTPEPRPIS